MKDKITRYSPVLIIICSLPSATLGMLWLVALVASRLVSNNRSDPFLLSLAGAQYLVYLLIILTLGPIPVLLAGILWVWLVIREHQISSKVWTGMFLVLAIYGLYIFRLVATGRK